MTHYQRVFINPQDIKCQQKRVLEDVLQWDIATWRYALALWEQKLPKNLSDYKALELGAAQGGPSLWLSLKGAVTLCSDIESPERRAEPLHKRYGVNLNYAAIDARNLPFEDESLDIICCKSVLGGIRKHTSEDPKPGIMQEILRVLKPGGYFLTADNLRGHWLHQKLRQRFVPWASGWEYFTLEAGLSMLKDFENVHYTTAGLTALIGRNPRQRQILGNIDQYLQIHTHHRLTPWHYMVAAVAQKHKTK